MLGRVAGGSLFLMTLMTVSSLSLGQKDPGPSPIYDTAAPGTLLPRNAGAKGACGIGAIPRGLAGRASGRSDFVWYRRRAMCIVAR